MIEQVDLQLRGWVQGVVGEHAVSFAPPTAQPAEDGAPTVGLYLMGLAERPPQRERIPPPLQVDLLYLVTTSAADPQEAHHLLGELLFAALEDPGMEVRLAEEGLWGTFRIPPRPAFLLQRPVFKPRAVVPVRRVTRPLELEATPVAGLEGRVEGPGGIPLANARVELVALGRSTRTDAAGRFRFAGLPTGPVPRELRVSARGHEISVTTGEADGGSLVVPFDPWEE